MNLFLTQTTASGGGSMVTTIMMLVLMVGIFYFMLIRPEKKKNKEMEAMRSSLKVGDRVTTIGGIMGTVCHVAADRIVIETGADQVRVEFAKWAISTNDSAKEKAEAEAKRAQEARKKAKAEKAAAKKEKKG